MLEVDHDTYWSPLFTHFPALGRYIPTGRYATAVHPLACVIGASDGKFALPLLRHGWRVDAIEIDQLFLDGGKLELRDGVHDIEGLISRITWEGLGERCQIIRSDYMSLPANGSYDLVMGSGLWSMPANRHYTLAALIEHAMDMVAPGGVFFADYLLPFTAEEVESPFYPEVQDMQDIISRPGWLVFENAELGIYGESHYGYEEWHYHRYAAAIVHRRRS